MPDADRLSPQALLAHVDWMRGLARALVLDADEARDLTQEGIEAALARPPLADRPVRPWLASVLRNLARLRARGRMRRARRERAVETASEPSSPEALALRVETERRVAALVLALEEPFRTTLLLRYYEGRSAAAIARAQGVPAGTVRWRLKHGLDRIRATLDAEEGGNRRWRALLLPLAARRPISPLIPGAIIMSSKTKLAAVVVFLLLLAGAGIQVSRSVSSRRAVQSAPRPAAARVTWRLAAGFAGLQVAIGPEREPAGELRLTGQVIDPSEAPVEGATVAIDTSPPRVALSDVNGAFSFAGLRPRTYRLEALAGALYAGPVETRVGAEPVVLRARPAGQVNVEVRAARDGAPIAGARVELRGTLVWRGETDARGEARLTGVGPGWRPMRVEAAGFAPVAQIVRTARGLTSERIAIRLEAGAAVSGRVVGPSGAPVAGARVWARSASEPFPVVDAALDGVLSDERGRWRIEALAAGSYQLVGAHPDFAQTITPPLVVSGPRADVEIRLDGGGRISGEVRDESGKPVAGAQVRAGSLTGMVPWPQVRDAFADASGRFQLTGLARRSIQVMALDEQGASAMATADLGVAAEATLTLTLSARQSIDGVVVDSLGKAVPEAQVSARPTERFKPGQPNPWDLRGLPLLLSDGAGRFRFSALPDGDYLISAAPPGAAPGTVALQPTTRARAGDRGIKVVVRGEGVVSGRVAFEDGTAPVSFSLDLGPVATIPIPFVGTGGPFSLEAPAGHQQLTVSGPAFVSRRLDRFEVQEGGRKDLGTITVVRGRSISGRVVAGDGMPVAGAQVVAGQHITGSGTALYIPTESFAAQETTSGEDGRFSLSGFSRGALVVIAEREGRGRSSTISITPGPQNSEVELVLRPAGSLEGRITRDGRPFADTVVIASPELGLNNFFVVSGQDGRYALDSLTPGSYLLIAFLNRNKDMLMRTVAIEAGRRARADLDARTGPITLTLRAETEDHATARARFILVAMALNVPEGTTLDELRKLARPTAPTLLVMRNDPGLAHIDGLTPGVYTACAGGLPPSEAGPRDFERLDSLPVRCLTRDVTGNSELLIQVPRARAPVTAR
jgi:RNA polymerase sigma factor (sigma-70 family)